MKQLDTMVKPTQTNKYLRPLRTFLSNFILIYFRLQNGKQSRLTSYNSEFFYFDYSLTIDEDGCEYSRRSASFYRCCKKS